VVLDPFLLWARREKKEKKGWGEKMKKRTVIYASGPRRAANHLNQASHTPGG
jgi:hypothetical protein